MQALKALLEATIRYQDVIDDFNSKSLMYETERMLNYIKFGEELSDLVEEARKRYPSLMAQYDFGFKKDRQAEFDNLQKFINDFSEQPEEYEAKERYESYR
jgi:DNA mismatch repair ATPase MutS